MEGPGNHPYQTDHHNAKKSRALTYQPDQDPHLRS